ncbi:MAG TPA: nicotinate-nucleotide--dimethylbenzimidazole phosphoribosyltransferase [Opitutaceae bacterium]
MTWQPPEIPPLAKQLVPELQARIDAKTKPPGSLGRLEELALALGMMQATTEPALRNGRVLVFAGDHGLAEEGVSPFPQAVTVQMVANFLAGGAAINVFARQQGLTFQVIDAGVAADLPPHPQLLACKVRPGTRNARREPALTRDEARQCLEQGARLALDLAADGADAFLPGEMGIGNTSASALLCSALLGIPLDDCVGSGAGHDRAGLARKLTILKDVQARHAGASAQDPIGALAAFGGCEIGMMAGAMIGAASQRLLIVVDGFIATAAVVLAERLRPGVLSYCVFSHVSTESGHAKVLRALGVRPLLDLGLRLGEGTGAVLAWPLLVSATAFLREMATFESAGVSEKANPTSA